MKQSAKATNPDDTPGPAPAKPRRKRSASQELRHQATRTKLVMAAARIIGKYGYAGCTIARVTARAKIAHGTFYLHFSSQQHLFDSILSELGKRMLHFIGDAVRNSHDILDLERRGFEATFAYLFDHPYMVKVTEEATFYAPEAYRQHIEELTSGYARSLKQACTRGQLERFAPEEMDMLANLLFGARRQMMWRFMLDNKLVPTPPAETVETYLKFISEGILGGRVIPARRPD